MAVGDRSAPTTATRRRTKRRRRRWYRRPLVLVPITIVVSLLAILGAVIYRTEATIATLHDLSTPPPIVSDATLDDDPDWRGVQVETGPAQEAIRAAAAAGGAPVDEGDGGVFSRVKTAASNVTDLAEGAAVAGGMSEPADSSYTILLMGVDARPGEPIDIAVRPDVLAVLRLDGTTHTCRILAIPRDTRVELVGYGETKINHALMVGGIPFQQLVVEQLLGMPIDRYLLVDFVAFQKLVDAVGGITVTVPEPFKHQGRTFEAGRQRLDGAHALTYARYRYDPDGDVGRIHRQWALLRGLAEAASGRDLVRDVNTFLPALEEHLRTDLTATELAMIAQSYGQHCSAETTTTALLAGTRVRLHDAMLKQPLYYNVVTEEAIAEQVTRLLGANTPERAPDLAATPGATRVAAGQLTWHARGQARA